MGQPGFATRMERVDGFQKAIRRNRLDPDRCPVAIGSIDVESAARRVEALMSGTNPPTALLAGNNMTSIGAMRGLKRMNLVVPRDMALLAFDDFECAACFEPQLPVIAQPCLAIRRSAAHILLDPIKTPERDPKTFSHQT